MNRHIITFALLFVLLAAVAADRPSSNSTTTTPSAKPGFKKGNLLALKQASITTAICEDGWLVEFTPSGTVVQEIALSNSSLSGCKVFTDDYYGRLTLSSDGARAILPCCHPSANNTQFSVSFAIIHSNGSISRTGILANSSSTKQVVNAVMDGMEVWFSQGSQLKYTAANSTSFSKIFEQDFFQVQINKKKLYVGNYDFLPFTVAQVGTGLPKQPVAGNGTAYLTTDPILSVNAFEFLEKYLVVNMYPRGINIYNRTSQALVYNVTDTDEVGQLVALLDEGKIIAHVHSIGSQPASIYSFPFSYSSGIGPLSNATLLLASNSTQGYAFKYYSPIRVPSSASGLAVSLLLLVAVVFAL